MPATTELLQFQNLGIAAIQATIAPSGTASDGGLAVTTALPSSRAAIDLHPTANAVKPTVGAFTELVLYTNLDGPTNLERLSISAIASGYGPYSFSSERAGTGLFKRLEFRYEDVTPGVADLVFAIDPGQANNGISGQGHPVEVQNGYLTFKVASQGGPAGDYYLARGGGSTLAIAVPSGAQCEFWQGNTTKVAHTLNSGFAVVGQNLYVPACQGLPTDTPPCPSGTVALRYDTTNHVARWYDGTWH